MLIGAQLLIGLTAWPAPADPHVSGRDRLELEVPPPSLHSVSFLRTEDPEPLPGAATHFSPGCCGEGGSAHHHVSGEGGRTRIWDSHLRPRAINTLTPIVPDPVQTG